MYVCVCGGEGGRGRNAYCTAVRFAGVVHVHVCVCMRARACMSTLADSSSVMLCSSFESRNGMCARPAFTPPPTYQPTQPHLPPPHPTHPKLRDVLQRPAPERAYSPSHGACHGQGDS